MKISEVIKNKKILIITAILIAAVAVSIFYCEERTRDDRVRASGTVEVTELNLSPQAGGRIMELNINESDHIKKGQLIARMSLDGADHDVEMAEASLAAAKIQLRELQNGFRKEDISRAEAEYALRKTQHEQAVRDYKRFKVLAADGVVPEREAELYEENAKLKSNAMKMAADTLSMLRSGMRSEQIDAAKANVKRAEAALLKAETLAGYKDFYSPAEGVILTKNYEVGDVISPGAPIATLGIMTDCWVKLYIPSTQLGLIKLGGSAEISVDACPGKKFRASVTEINQQAEYNPRLSLTQSERSNMVFWIKLSVDDPEGILKPGMPADALIL
ncbi:MAG: efflux RND transporter periplasmic adaptor subunit [Synergistaceae bacterium]|nr:efflux RND transporter periplasmic adaptor subunit [Synergistaceae bacterium]